MEIKILGLFHRGISIIYMKIEGNLNEKESAINLLLALQYKTSNLPGVLITIKSQSSFGSKTDMLYLYLY